MDFVWSNNANITTVVVTSCLLFVVCALIFFMLVKVVRRKIPIIIYSSLTLILFVSYLLNLHVVTYLTVGLIVCTLILSLFVNLGDLRKFLSNPFQVTQAKQVNHKKVEKIFDSEALGKEIEKAVMILSKSKTGAIMTFEKGNSLSDIIKNGVAINAPVSAELLTTIFYPGTRLHDGAVVIHGNEIIAASVFFTPTTKAFAGKYGSRHRAAIGISEISDSVTVVVSEETGRISFATNGTLESVDQMNFLRVFENLLNDKK